MKRITILFIIIITSSLAIKAQKSDSTGIQYLNTAEILLKNDGKLNLGGYGEVHYNQPVSKNQKNLGTLDVHRLVMFMGYNFSKKTQFVSEIEFEYANEISVEQAFLQQRINKFINIRAGLLLVPMGVINEYHEPVTFNGVERPLIDNRISLSTWREVGIGLSGNLLPVTLKYQIYAVSGLNGYDTKAIFKGSGLREGRQKGSKAYLSSPAVTGKIEFYGIKNLNIGISGYFGKSQSKLYGNLPDANSVLQTVADSSSVGIAMVGADSRFRLKGLEIRSQFYYTIVSNTAQYNIFTRTETANNDLGKSMLGYYIEAGYNVFNLFSDIDRELIPFIRYELSNTHQTVDKSTPRNPTYKNTLITTGLTFKLNKGAVFKSDIQFMKSGLSDEFNKTFNAGIGVMF